MNEVAVRKTMTPEQIQLERKLTCEAIDGAMAFGHQNTNPPPSEDHWLAPYWRLGRTLATIADSPAQAAEAVAIPAGWKLVPVEPTEEMTVAGRYACDDNAWTNARHVFAAMLDAAPQPPAPAATPASDHIADATRMVGAQKKLTRCAADRDGDCDHAQCPQIKDDEPRKSRRHCPLDIGGDDDE